jgi:hypothetical protein
VISPRRLRAPRDNGAVVAEPPLSEVGRLLASNRQQLDRTPARFLGRAWDDLRRQARQSGLEAAQAYLREAGEPIPPAENFSLLMAGHQPELFHPGVWVKNFALYGLARRHGAVPVNLIVDNDSVKSTALHVPSLYDIPHLVRVAFDRTTLEIPYEERPVLDEEQFTSLPARVPWEWNFTPILRDFWTAARQQGARTQMLGERLVGARRAWERRWGCHNLEVPVSRICRTEPFAWFACHLLDDLPRFHTIHNECVRAYRQQYGIRSRIHPVPDLGTEGDWLETPFWAWRQGEQRRGRLMARRNTLGVELRVGSESWGTLPLSIEYSALSTQYLVNAWQALEHGGCKVRPRALTNTLYARLFLCDLFIHGIGGGKYDELTDEIARQFYGIELPGFLVLSATLLLPIPFRAARPDDCRRLAHELRDLHWNPQRHASLDSAAAKLALQKQAWINQQPDTRQGRRERFHLLRELTEHLREFTGHREQELSRDLAHREQQVQANTLLQRRDYAFCLYPEALLRAFCTRFLDPL